MDLMIKGLLALKPLANFLVFFPVAHLIWPLMSPKRRRRKKKVELLNFFLFLVPLFLTPASSVACCAVSFWGGLNYVVVSVVI